jgi:hypothetical protein
MVKLTEIFEESATNRISVRNVFVNPAHVVMIRDDSRFSSFLREGRLVDLGVDSKMTFTRITVRGGTGNYDITVFGDTETVYEKVRTSQKNLLKG